MENFSAPEYPKATSHSIKKPDTEFTDDLSIDTVYPWIFIQCGLPYNNPGTHVWARSNGDIALDISAGTYRDPDTYTLQSHLPYGISPRILLMWLATESARTQSPRLDISTSLRGLIRDLGLSWRGSTHAQGILRQLRALLAMTCTITRRTYDETGAISTREEIFTIGSGAELHFAADMEDIREDRQSVVILSEEFFKYLIRGGSLPVMTARWRDLIAHTKSPLAADIFLWLSSRLPSVQSDTRISWDQLAGQFGSNTAAGKKFRERFRLGLEHALSVYPEALVSEVGAGARSGFRGLILHPSPGSDLTGLHWAYQPRPLTGDSTAEDPPGDTPAPPPSSEVYRGVDLTQLRADLSTVGITTEGTSDTGLQRAIGTILTRAASPVGSPQRYVTVAITADPTLLTGEALTAAAIRAATQREAPSPSTPATEGNSSLPTGGICSICYDPYNGAVCPSCAAELISADPIPTDILTELWEALKGQLQGAGHNPGSSLYTRYENAYQYHTQNDHV